MNELTKLMQEYLATATKEELDKEWEELKESNAIGYLVSELADLVLFTSPRQFIVNQKFSTTYESPESSLGFFYFNYKYGSSFV